MKRPKINKKSYTLQSNRANSNFNIGVNEIKSDINKEHEIEVNKSKVYKNAIENDENITKSLRGKKNKNVEQGKKKFFIAGKFKRIDNQKNNENLNDKNTLKSPFKSGSIREEKITDLGNAKSFEIKNNRDRKRNINTKLREEKRQARGLSGMKEISFRVSQKGTSNIMLTFVVILLVLSSCLILMSPTIRAWVNQSREYQKLEQEITNTKARNEELKKKLEKLNESAYVANEARKRLGYVRKGEITYVVVDPETITNQKEEDKTNQRAPRKPWFSLVVDSIKAVEDTKAQQNKEKIQKNHGNRNKEGAKNDSNKGSNNTPNSTPNNAPNKTNENKDKKENNNNG